MATHALHPRKSGRRPVRRAGASFARVHTPHPPPSERSNQVFLIVLYLLLALGSALFLALVYGVLFMG